MRILPVGESALLLEFSDEPDTAPGAPATAETQVSAWHAELVRRRDAGEFTVGDLVPGARTLLLDGLDRPDAVRAAVRGTPAPAAVPATEGPLVEVPAVYDGPDLADVAALWGVGTDDVVERHTGTEFRVAFCGFSPGFGYLTGLPGHLAVPRLEQPRTAVPAGSIGLAGPYTGIYPSESPGGWRLIGRTDLVLFDASRQPPALLRPGVRVRFRVR